VEIGHRQQLGFTILNPLAFGKGLALRAVPMATGMIGVPLEPTGGTMFGVPTELHRSTGFKITHHPLMRGGHGMDPTVCRAIEAEDISDFPRWSTGLAHGWRTCAVSGMRRHGVTPAWAGVGPHRAGGRTGCGASPDTAA